MEIGPIELVKSDQAFVDIRKHIEEKTSITVLL